MTLDEEKLDNKIRKGLQEERLSMAALPEEVVLEPLAIFQAMLVVSYLSP